MKVDPTMHPIYIKTSAEKIKYLEVEISWYHNC